MNENKKNEKKQAVKNPWIVVAAVIYFIIRWRLRNGSIPAGGLAPMLVVVLIPFLGFAASVVKSAKNTEKNAATPTKTALQSRASTQPTIKLHSDDRPHRDFSAPEAYCVVCENTGEDHLAFDRAQRLRQLDDWLKNGLIDRAEYRVLKETFEKNG